MDHTIQHLRQQLEEERARFRSTLPANIAELWRGFRGRIAVVLSGGGARGGYEAGTLLAFQDAGLPTHILTSTSIGSINAASYAAHSEGYVGKAEALIDSWLDVVPTALGIDWSRYIVVLAGLIIASAGFGNLIRYWMSKNGYSIHLVLPAATWISLGMAGLSILFFYSQLTYIYYVAAAKVSGRKWKPEPRKLAFSAIGNVCVWAFVVLFINYAHLDFSSGTLIHMRPETRIILGGGTAFLLLLWLSLRDRLSRLSREFLRLPLRSGLFPNFERARFLREAIPAQGFRRSPIRVVFTAADVKTGDERYFVNAPLDQVAADPGVNRSFVQEKMETTEDVIQAVIASSAYPMVYEVVPINGNLFTDGGIVAVEPIRPAIRLGADVLFLVLVQPLKQEPAPVQTFLDVAMHTFDILMSQNLKVDLEMLKNANSVCMEHAARLKVRPEEVSLDVGGRDYRYMKSFTVQPSSNLNAGLLDFDGKIVAPDILRGYIDGEKAIAEFLAYVAEQPDFTPKYLLRLHPEEVRQSVVQTNLP